MASIRKSKGRLYVQYLTDTGNLLRLPPKGLTDINEARKLRLRIDQTFRRIRSQKLKKELEKQNGLH